MGCTRVKTTWGIGGRAGGSRYHTEIPNVKLGRLKVAITGLLMTPGERGRESYGLKMSPDNSLMVACGGEVVVAAACSATATDDVVAAIGVAAPDDVVVLVGAIGTVVVWVQWCLMRPCTISQFHFVSVVVTLMGKEPSWWDQKTTQGPHSTMGRLVCFQP